MMKNTLGLLVALLLAPLSGLLAADKPKVNILHIHADDHRTDGLRALGTATGPVREAVVHHSINGSFAVRQGQWKLELCKGSGGWSKGGLTDAPGQLYDMSKDVGEQANECNQHPEIVSRLTKLLEKYVADGRSTLGPSLKNDVPVDVRKKNAQKGKAKEQ